MKITHRRVNFTHPPVAITPPRVNFTHRPVAITHRRVSFTHSPVAITHARVNFTHASVAIAHRRVDFTRTRVEFTHAPLRAACRTVRDGPTRDGSGVATGPRVRCAYPRYFKPDAAYPRRKRAQKTPAGAGVAESDGGAGAPALSPARERWTQAFSQLTSSVPSSLAISSSSGRLTKASGSVAMTMPVFLNSLAICSTKSNFWCSQAPMNRK